MANNTGFTPSNHFEIIKLTLTDRYGNEWDIKDFLIEMNIYHSLFQMTSTGNLIVGDPSNIRFNQAIFGGELITIKYKNAGMDKTTELKYVVKCHGEQIQMNMAAAIRYQLITEEAFIDSQKTYSIPFNGDYGSLVKTLLKYTQTEKKISVGISTINNKQTSAMPYCSPLTGIRWACSRAYGLDKTPFLFYEDVEGYNFKSIGELLSLPSSGKFYYEPLGLTDDDGLRQLFTIRKLEFKRNTFNHHELAKSLPNRNQFFFDPRNKSCEKVSTSYESIFNSVPTLEKNKIPYMLQDSATVWQGKLDDNSHTFKVYRDYFVQILDQFGFKFVTLAGDHLRVGYVYEFDPINTEVTIDGKKYPETFIRGRYLLTNIKRTFTTKEYTTSCEIIKDSLFKEV